MWRKNALALLVGLKTSADTLENSTEVPQKGKNRTTPGSSNHTTEYLPKEYKNINSKRDLFPDVYSSIIYNSQDMEAARVHQFFFFFFLSISTLVSFFLSIVIYIIGTTCVLANDNKKKNLCSVKKIWRQCCSVWPISEFIFIKY